MAKKQKEEDYTDYTLTDLAAVFRSATEELDRAKVAATEAQNKYDLLRKIVIPAKMEEMGVESMRIKGIGTLGKRYDAYCSVVSGAQQELQEWLISQGKGDVIKPTVNPSTLKALIKEMFNAGEELPEALVNFSPYTYAVITNKPKD